MYQIWRIYLDLWGHDCKKYVWPTFGCKLGQSDPIVMQLKLDMSCHLLNVYTKFQIDISKHVEEKSGKRGRTDGRTDGQTDGWHNTSRFSNGRIKTTYLGNLVSQRFIIYLYFKACYFPGTCLSANIYNSFSHWMSGPNKTQVSGY